MRTRFARRWRHHARTPETPLVDVALVVLVCLATSLLMLMYAGPWWGVGKAEPEPQAISTLPPVAENWPRRRLRDVNDEPPPSAKVYASISTQGGVSLNGGRAIYNVKDELPAALAGLLAQNTASGRPRSEVQLLISPRPDTEFGAIFAVYEAAQAAGFANIGFQAAN